MVSFFFFKKKNIPPQRRCGRPRWVPADEEATSAPHTPSPQGDPQASFKFWYIYFWNVLWCFRLLRTTFGAVGLDWCGFWENRRHIGYLEPDLYDDWFIICILSSGYGLAISIIALGFPWMMTLASLVILIRYVFLLQQFYRRTILYPLK